MKDDFQNETKELYTVIARKKIQVNECKIDYSNNVGIVSNWLSFPWACFFCGHSSVDYKVLHKHLTKVHGISNSKDFLYKCTDCGNCYDDYALFLNHIRMDHHDALKRCCDVCGERFYGCEYLSLHRQNHVMFEKVYPPIYHCSSCIAVFSSPIKVREHHKECHEVQEHSEHSQGTSNEKEYDNQTSKTFNCRYCKKPFSRLFKKTAHEYLHTGERPFVCSRCSRGFISKDSLRRHMLLQRNQPAFKCDCCPLDFKYLCQLKKHKEEHFYKCEKCLKKFEKKQLFMKHLLTEEHLRNLSPINAGK